MNTTSLVKAGVLTLALAIVFVLSWELYLRGKGVDTSYDDDAALWSDKRAMVYEPADKATVFIGSSRNKYDVDIPTWKKLTGDHVIQLSCVGSTPLPVLDNLAADTNFKGKLVVDVTELLFFSISPHGGSKPSKFIAYYNKRTPAQRFGFLVDHVLESQFAFLDKEEFSLNAMLDHVKLPSRDTMPEFPGFPWQFERVTFDRQCYMNPEFVADTNLHKKVQNVWDFFRKTSKDPPLSGHPLDSLLVSIKNDVDQIQARGGKVLFLRTPSSGPYLMGEKMGWPRDKYWDRLLAETGCPGIHFADYPAIDHFECPEFSHLKPADAIVFTTNLVEILQKDKGWVFPHKN